MKVTPEMVRRALDAWGEARDDGIVEDWAPMHLALEAALADVPEPGPVAVQNFIRGKLESERADRAEAKLKKVRAWFETFPHNNKTLRVILDEEP